MEGPVENVIAWVSGSSNECSMLAIIISDIREPHVLLSFLGEGMGQLMPWSESGFLDG